MIREKVQTISAEQLKMLERDITVPFGVYCALTTDADAGMPRQNWLNSFTEHVHLMVTAADAATALAQLTHREGAAVIVLPTWVWVKSLVNVGASKNACLMPARIVWNTPTVLVATAPITAHWHLEGLGHTTSGTLTIRPVDTAPHPEGGSQSGETPLPATIAAVRVSGARVHHILTELAASGRAARWLALEQLSRSVFEAVDKARFAIARDLNPEGDDPVFDDLTRDRIATGLLYGNDGDQDGATSPAWRMLDRCTKPHTFAGVDPLHYVRTAIQRDAFDAAKHHLGDPRVGPRVRAVARQLQTSDVHAIVTAYRELYPRDRLSTGRALRALTLGPDISTQTVMLRTDGEES